MMNSLEYTRLTLDVSDTNFWYIADELFEVVFDKLFWTLLTNRFHWTIHWTYHWNL